MDNTVNTINLKTKNIKISILIFFVLVLFFILNAPVDFPEGRIFSVEPGKSLRSTSLMLKEQNIIRSRLLFEMFIIMYGGEKHIMSADYYFEKKIPVYEVARRIEKGDRRVAPVKVTIPEGFTVAEIASLLQSKFPEFDQEKFLAKAESLQGYLFPDTYFFFRDDSEEKILNTLFGNFKNKISNLAEAISKSGRSEKDIVIMASLVEGEAKGEADRALIAGILWKRISIGMPLQVDVSPETYKEKGLPDKPVGNPGLRAIQATLYPEKSDYLYYLHDRDGVVHFAKNFLEHQANIKKYLKN